MRETSLLRRTFLGLGIVELAGCCGSRWSGDPAMMDALANYSRKSGLGVGLLGSGVVYARSLVESEDRSDIVLPGGATSGGPAILIDWGRALASSLGGMLRVVDLHGDFIGEVEREINLYGCVLDRMRRRVLFWGSSRSRQTEFGLHLGDLSTGEVRTISEWRIDPSAPSPSFTASFFPGNIPVIRICKGFDNYFVGTDGRVVEKRSWRLELTGASPDGKFVAGRQPNGRLGIIDVAQGTVSDTDIPILGRSTWDPSSRYILTLTPSHSMPLCAPTHLLIADAVTRKTVRLTPIVVDERYHPYEWILRPERS
jgi:hypothetical protein